MKQLGVFITGVALMLIGIVTFLQNTIVGGFSLMYRYGGFNAGGLLMILMAVALIWTIVKPQSAGKIIFGVLLGTFIVGLILNLDIRMARMTGLEIMLIIGTMAVGIALVIKSLLSVK